MKFSAIILAGGKSSRMKINKALLPIKDKTFIEEIAEQLKDSFDEIIVITNTPEQYEFLPFEKYPDIVKNKGPLSGIHSGLTHARNKYSFVTACDMPFIDGTVARNLCDMTSDYDGVVPKNGEFLQPLFAVYSKNCIPYIEKCLNDEQYKIIAFYPYAKILYPKWSNLLSEEKATKNFFNINTPEDLKTFRKYHEN
ncbi:MAG: hypothetical protein APF76_09075 [Desulfitibacter sp. BRH_c19]|nr:MAG: hypothetical protein APF76_09075 [Desulfitibacter sp. BRH_c19]